MKAALRELTLTNGKALAELQFGETPFEATIQAVIGPADGDGEELFDFSLKMGELDTCEVLPRPGYLWRQHTLLMTAFDAARIHLAVAEVLRSVEGESWSAVVEQLRRFFRWEFDGY